MRLGGMLTNRLVLTIDLHLSAPSLQLAHHRRLHEVARKLLSHLAIRQIPATFGLSRPGYGQLADWISSDPQHETALLMQPSGDWRQWGGSGLVGEVRRLAGDSVRSVFAHGPLGLDHASALRSAGILAIRGNGATLPGASHQNGTLWFEPNIQAPSFLARLTEWLPQRFDFAKPTPAQVMRICGETVANAGPWATDQALRAIDFAAKFRDRGGSVETLANCASQLEASPVKAA
ncbi:hypothetical protein [Blastopirellula retiformator]|uniref:Uncharacterized protein n=1 Tax=Blastopirellula retiformator TaxID=2527970 RepID=A0A5C5V2W0_9BACT|nr:hypothetical protein [Blastopirellula retiformator]TWT32025.1 hypothetical protein Enr8_39510 [Blastopirellula retiformator]